MKFTYKSDSKIIQDIVHIRKIEWVDDNDDDNGDEDDD